MNKFDTWNIELSYGNYIKRLIERGMPPRSSDLSKERVCENVLTAVTKAIEEGRLRVAHGVASIKSYLRKTITTKIINYCRDYDPETDMRLAPEKFGSQREIAKRKKERGDMDRGEIHQAFESFGMDFKENVLHKEVFLLHMEGKTPTEIAETTGLNTPQVKNRYDSTMRKLRKNPTALLAKAEYTQNESRYYDQKRERPLIELPLKSLPREIKGLDEKEDKHS